MIRTYLGKITSAEFGLVRDYPFMMGLKLQFKFEEPFKESGYVGDGWIYTVNMNPGSDDRKTELEKRADGLYQLLKIAKCQNVSELKGKPVELTLDGNTFKSMRILTEVL